MRTDAADLSRYPDRQKRQAYTCKKAGIPVGWWFREYDENSLSMKLATEEINKDRFLVLESVDLVEQSFFIACLLKKFSAKRPRYFEFSRVLALLSKRDTCEEFLYRTEVDSDLVAVVGIRRSSQYDTYQGEFMMWIEKLSMSGGALLVLGMQRPVGREIDKEYLSDYGELSYFIRGTLFTSLKV